MKVWNSIKNVLSQIAAVILTERVIKMVILWGLKQAARRTDNKVDDEVIKIVDEALNSK